MITFRTLKLKHYRRAQKIYARIASEDAEDVEIVEFAASLVASWDFKDADTGEDLALSDLDELSTPQIEELLTHFAEEFTGSMSVPKGSAEHSPST
jgi:hypothetical protein